MVYVSILFCLIFFNVIDEFLVIYIGVSENLIYIIFYPILEEVLKYSIVMRFSANSMGYVIWFALLEFVLAKIPVLFVGAEAIDYYLIVYAIFPFIFHVGSGLFYNSFRKCGIFTLLAMVLVHICLNFSVEIVYYWGVILYVSLSVIPYFLLLAKFQGHDTSQ